MTDSEIKYIRRYLADPETVLIIQANELLDISELNEDIANIEFLKKYGDTI